MIVVTDAGPLIYLGGSGQRDLLRRLFDTVVVPRLVFEEVTVHGAGQVGAAAVAAATWLLVEDQPPDPLLLRTLDAGESAAIPLAERLAATLLVDDADARAVARIRGLTVVGSLGVLLGAKRDGYLAAVKPALDAMVQLGMFVSPELRTRVLALAGEE